MQEQREQVAWVWGRPVRDHALYGPRWQILFVVLGHCRMQREAGRARRASETGASNNQRTGDRGGRNHLLRGLETNESTEPVLDAEYCLPTDPMLDVDADESDGGRDPVLVSACQR